MIKEFYTVQEFAQKFSIHPETIRKSIKNGRIQAIRVGIGKRTPFRIPHDEVQRLSLMSFDQVVRKFQEKGENV